MPDETTTTVAPPASADTAPKTVALENFQAVVHAKQGLESQVASLKSQIQSLTEKAATVDTLSGQINEWRTKAAEAEGKFASFTELSGALGTTDVEIVGLFDAKWKALPEEARPARAEWVTALKSAPDTAPALLRPWLAPAPVAAPEPTPPKAKPTAPRVPGTPATPPSAPAVVTDAEIRRVRQEAERTGDWGPWREMRRAMGLVR